MRRKEKHWFRPEADILIFSANGKLVDYMNNVFKRLLPRTSRNGCLHSDGVGATWSDLEKFT